MAEWNAYFTTDVPYEPLTDLLIALGTRTVADIGTAGPQTVLNALSAKGWIRDLDRRQTTATDAAFTRSVSLVQAQLVLSGEKTSSCWLPAGSVDRSALFRAFGVRSYRSPTARSACSAARYW
ncbi:hypothetical protein AB0I49_15935 [Streptomyces sp. NPDC050617]|uniref:hypothetical protein n=1 Tax=Streptomyces sp. NPDC050617 TaxID=3154628 RepID=UPI0034422B0D